MTIGEKVGLAMLFAIAPLGVVAAQAEARYPYVIWCLAWLFFAFVFMASGKRDDSR